MVDLKYLIKYEIGNIHRGCLIFYHISITPTCFVIFPHLVVSDNLIHFS